MKFKLILSTAFLLLISGSIFSQDYLTSSDQLIARVLPDQHKAFITKVLLQKMVWMYSKSKVKTIKLF